LLKKKIKEQFDKEEITAYIVMALEELCCIDSAINEWVNYRVLSFASTAVGLNEEDSRKKSRFLKKAEIFRNKMPYIEGVYTKNE